VDFQGEYQKKLMTPEEAVMLIKDGDWIEYGQTASFAPACDAALAKRKGDLKDVKIWCAIAPHMPDAVKADPEHESFIYNTWHASADERHGISQGYGYFSPQLYRDQGSYYEKGYARCDVVMISTPPMDKYGNFNFALNNSCMQEAIDSADRVIIEVIEDKPTVFGLSNDHINIKDVTAVVEGHGHTAVFPMPGITEVDEKIARLVFPYIEDGDTLQLGIGGMPNAIGTMIAGSDLKNLGMHTEVMNDGYVKLYKAGVMNDSRKRIFRGKGVYSVCFGSRELYDYMDYNQGMLSVPMGMVNDPWLIKEYDHFVSINGCIACDIYGQVSSESVGTRQISGTGGQLDFVTGTYLAEHGKSFLTMPAEFTDKDGNRHSNIKAIFTDGDIITTPRTQTQYVATEYGVAFLPGKTTWQRAEELIGIAAPQYRDELIAAAEKQHVWRASNKR